MRDDSQLRPCSGKTVPKSCNMKGNSDNAVPIDVDSDELDDVVIINAPDSLRQKLEGSSVLRRREKFPLRGIISIDDDETTNVDQPRTDIADCGGDLDSDASSRSCPAAKCVRNSVDSGDDECQVVQERKSAFKLSRCNRTYSRTAPSKNRPKHYGLNSESENGSSESDYSDCELMEGSLGKVREQWEKASLRRKYNACNINSGLDSVLTPSGSHSGANENAEADNGTPSVCSDSSNADLQMGSTSAFPATGNGDLGEASFSPEMESVFVGSSQKLNGESYSGLRSCSTVRNQSSQCESSAQYREETSNEDSHGCAVFYNKASYEQPKFWAYGGQQGDKQYNAKFWFMGEEKNSIRETYADHQYTGVPNEHASMHNSKYPSERHVNNERVLERKDATPATTFCNIRPRESENRTGCRKREEKVSLGSLACDAQSSDGLLEKNGLYPSMKKSKQGMPHLVEVKESLITPTSACNFDDDRVQLYIPTGDSTPSIGDIINDREKLKETDEYKRAVEEEWASRQRQLQIQAEEAQRLRKRRKAENIRVLDMARRQKERVEEIRETQKKDEESMSLKEQFRVEVLKELNKLEMTCIDMASLLRGLGIHVGGGFEPLSNEVHSAYKRALLKFHPDRASRTDIRQQVESEEKFKLISRMKEKFLSTWCN